APAARRAPAMPALPGPAAFALPQRFSRRPKRRRAAPAADASTAAGHGEHEQDQYLTSNRPEME
ncbi:hypothetical protein, partial [Actinomadura bangladeshensis]|uniref:hypothetical protein n=1 Tax=Actinomadura bangladeshensis TaxID=453573 RepID=UPI0019432B93